MKRKLTKEYVGEFTHPMKWHGLAFQMWSFSITCLSHIIYIILSLAKSTRRYIAYSYGTMSQNRQLYDFHERFY